MTTIYRGIVPNVTIDMLCYWLHNEGMNDVIVNWAYSESETDEGAAYDLDRSNWRGLWLNTQSPYFAHFVILAPLKGRAEEFHKEYQRLIESNYVSTPPVATEIPSLPKGLIHSMVEAAERNPGILWRENIARIGELRAEQRHFAKVRIVLMEYKSGLWFADSLREWLKDRYSCKLTHLQLTRKQWEKWDDLQEFTAKVEQEGKTQDVAAAEMGTTESNMRKKRDRLREEIGIDPPWPWAR